MRLPPTVQLCGSVCINNEEVSCLFSFKNAMWMFEEEGIGTL